MMHYSVDARPDMKFSDFAQLMAEVCREGETVPVFVERLFDLISDDELIEAGRLHNRSSSTLRNYYNGSRDISGIASTISRNPNRQKFEEYLETLNVGQLERLWELFAPHLQISRVSDLPAALADLYADIIHVAAGKHPGPKSQTAIEDRLELETALAEVIGKLARLDGAVKPKRLHMNGCRVKKKATECSDILINDIVNNVVFYYNYINEQLALLEAAGTISVNLILSQVQTCYQSLKASGVRQPDAFYRVRDWLMEKTGCGDELACTIMTSYFVQNCEVFDAPSK